MLKALLLAAAFAAPGSAANDAGLLERWRAAIRRSVVQAKAAHCDQAEVTGQEALNLADKGGLDEVRVAHSLSHLAAIKRLRDSDAEAALLLDRARAIYEKHTEWAGELVSVLDNEASVLLDQNRQNDALPLAKRAVTVARALAKNKLALSLANLSNAESDDDQPLKEEELKEALSLARPGGDDRLRKAILKNLAMVSYNQAKDAAARDYYRQMLKLSGQLLTKDDPEFIGDLEAYAHFLEKTGSKDQAKPLRAEIARLKPRQVDKGSCPGGLSSIVEWTDYR